MRILIVKMSSMGDVVHAQPVAVDIRRHCPGATIDWVVEAPFAFIPAMNPAVDQVLPISWRKWRRRLRDAEVRRAVAEFGRRLRARRYDWIIDCQGLLKSAAVVRLARGERRAGLGWSYAREPFASLAYDLRARVPRDLHVVRRNREIAAQALGYRVDEPADFGLAAPPLTTDWMPRRAYAVLVTGASRPEKLWPDAHWVAIGRQLIARGLSLVWLWGSAEEGQRARSLAQAAGSESDSAIPPFLSVADAASVLAGARLVVGLDTGFTHLAGALARPTIAIFCDFDATQCAVSGASFCESHGGVRQVPTLAAISAAVERAFVQPQPV